MQRGLEFLCLGVLEVLAAGKLLSVGGPVQRGLLAVLLLNVNRSVSADHIISSLWSDPPETALGQVQTRVWRIRRMLHDNAACAPDDRPHPTLVTRPGGYSLVADPHDVDLLVFADRVERADTLVAGGRIPDAAAELRQALALWRGPAFANVSAVGVRAEAEALEERHLLTMERLMEIELSLGRHRQIIPELRELTAQHPFRENLRSLLMRALQRSGRRAEAIETYLEGYRALAKGMGLEPSPMLRQLHRAIISDDDEPAGLPGGPRETVVRHATRTQNLPRDLTSLVGRAPELQQVSDYLATTRESPRPSVVGICGPVGVGSTALAVRVAHLMLTDLPDGQLFAHLGDAPDPGAILRRFLHMLGVDDNEIPETVEERSALFRAVVADRRIVLLLDDVHDEAHVRPLLPGSSGSVTLVTSRRPLTAIEGVYHLDLAPLEPDDARALLGSIIGPDRVATESEAACRVLRRCAGLPLAIRSVGARLSARRHWSLTRFADVIDDAQRRLDALAFGDLNVRQAMLGEYRRLTPEAQRLFRRLGIRERADFTETDVAELLGVDIARAEDLVDELIGGHFVLSAPTDAPGPPHFEMQDLWHLLARECGLAEEAVSSNAGTRESR